MRFAILFIGDISVFLGRRSANIFLAAWKTRTGGQERVKKSVVKRRGEDPACDSFSLPSDGGGLFLPPPLCSGGVSWLTHFPLRHCMQAGSSSWSEGLHVQREAASVSFPSPAGGGGGGYTHAQAATLYTHIVSSLSFFLVSPPLEVGNPPGGVVPSGHDSRGGGFCEGGEKEARAARKGCGKK